MGIFLDPALADVGQHHRANGGARTMLRGVSWTPKKHQKRGLITRITEEGGLDAEISATVKRSAPAPRWRTVSIRKHPQVRMQGDESEEQARAASYGDTEDYRNAWTSFMAKKKPSSKAAESFRCKSES